MITTDTRFDEDFEYRNLTVATKKRVDLGDDSFLSLHARVTYEDYGVGADYYFNKRLSVGFAYDWYGNFDVDTTTVNANWFITVSVSVNAALARFDNGFVQTTL